MTRMKDSHTNDGRRGSALITALVGTLILGILVAASLSRCLFTWNQIGRSYHHASALYTAESGIEMTVYAMNHQEISEDPVSATGQFESELASVTGLGEIVNLTGELSDASGRALGNYDVDIYQDPENERRFIVTSLGIAPPEEFVSENRAGRTVRVVIEKPPLFPEQQRRLTNDAVFSETYIYVNGDTTVHGNTRSGELLQYLDPTLTDDPALHVTRYEYEYYDEETDTVLTDFGEVYEGFNMDASPENDIVLPFDEYMLEQYKDMAKWQGYYFEQTPEIDEVPTQFYQPDGVTPNVVFISSNVKLSGGYTIGGLIFIVGNGDFGGGNVIEGIVYCTGRFWGHGGGGLPLNVNGAVFGHAVDIRGTTDITYEWEYYHTLMDPPQPEPKYIFRSWQELIGEQLADAGTSPSGIVSPPGRDRGR